MFCTNCGEKVADGANVCLKCGKLVEDAAVNTTTGAEKSKIVAALLAWFLGTFGAHNFYLGYTGKAVAQLLITILTCGIGAIGTGIWAIIEMIMILTGSISHDANGNPIK